MNNSWYLEDVTEIAKDAPYTFYLPSKKLIQQFAQRNIVKLMFSCGIDYENDLSAERI